MLLPSMSVIADVAYAAAENLLFTLLSCGKILKASTRTNPCKKIQEWDTNTKPDAPNSCTCLCLYEYVVEDELEGHSWGDLITNLKSKKRAEELESQGQSVNAYDRTLLLGGCVDGMIVVFDWQNEKAPGKVSFQIEAHRDEVITMVANPVVDQVISAGLDRVIKIWRLFPFAEEALAPLMTLFCHETPRLLTVAHHKLCAAFHEPSTASYNTVVFKTTKKKRFHHSSDSDHMDDVTGLTSCSKMRLFASCSADGSVRIWDEASRLLRVIKLNATPTSIGFSSQKGDLIVGIGKHLHKISYASYMPQSYIFRMVAMDFRRVFSEAPIDIDEDIMDRLTTDEFARLTQVKSSLDKYSGFQDTLPQDEMDEKIQEEDRRNQAFAKIQDRENELRKLRDGTYEFTRKRQNIDIETVRGEAFERYLEIFYKRPHLDLPDDTLEDDEGFAYEEDEEEPYSADRGNGFFSISRQSTRSKKSQFSPVKPPKSEIMSLSMSEFEPIKLEEDSQGTPTLPPTKELDEMSRSERPFTMETESEIFMHEETSSRVSHSAPSRKRDFRRHPIEPPLVNRDRDRYTVDVPKSNRYPSPSQSVQLVSQRLSRVASHKSEVEGEEMFVIAPDGFIPNSVVVAMFKDLREEGKEKAEPWKPPQLTAEQLAELESRKKKTPVSPESPKKGKVKSKFADQLQLALRDIPSPEPVDDTELFKSPTPTPPSSPPPEKEPSPIGIPSPKKEVKPLRPIEKLVSRPKPPTPQPTPPPPKEPTPTPTPPPPPTPLPSFISQFKGTLWFEKFFPDAKAESFPKPCSAESFVELLLSLIQRTADYELKTQICAVSTFVSTHIH